ncbi:2-OXO-4-HYDROXY-4-CARBOXY-5-UREIDOIMIDAZOLINE DECARBOXYLASE-RELATED [Salix purpurea]|uniref:2-oxo-4-hydroxy-4-carboxy-5-ureidoimidazoline decarboxylase n=1 Tax=Salix purpurea TaxID=77065 RepID=A0A9Q0PEZ2_SALPP|nr:2-OXO-4-HYDROXY-4-CARBOXY-5-UREIDOIMIDAZOLINE DECARBOXYLASE-RELATED [Salix purpurea]
MVGWKHSLLIRRLVNPLLPITLLLLLSGVRENNLLLWLLLLLPPYRNYLDWNARYRHKFGFIFLICASGRSTAEILADLKKRYPNRPIVEFEIAAQEQMKVTELRLVKALFK